MSTFAESDHLRKREKDVELNVAGFSAISPTAKESSGYASASEVTGNGQTLESVTRVRRLFNFSQIFAFSLTFMSTWEGMNT